MNVLKYWLVVFSFLIIPNWCFGQSVGCNIKQDIGTFFVEVESYNSRNGTVKIVIRNSSSRHVNINIRLMGTYSSLGRSTYVFEENDVYKPGRTTKTVNVSALYDIKTRKSEFPYIIDDIRLSGPDYDGYIRELNQNEKFKEELKNLVDRNKSRGD